jgi:hypothetical protein
VPGELQRRVPTPRPDNWAVQQAAQALTGYGGLRRRATVIVPIHYETLAAMRLREPLLDLCRTLPKASSRYLVLEILGHASGCRRAASRS